MAKAKKLKKGPVKKWSDFKDLTQTEKFKKLEQIPLILNEFDKEDWTW